MKSNIKMKLQRKQNRLVHFSSKRQTFLFRIFCLIENILAKRNINIRKNLALNFLEVENHQKLFRGRRTQSEALQDIFALYINEFSKLSNYLEIGSGEPIVGNNTYILEMSNWTGVSIEIDSKLCDKFAQIRKQPVINGDATSLNYEIIMQTYFPNKFVGFLQVDIDPAAQALSILFKIPFESYRFACIVFEHDKYRNGRKIRNLQRRVLSSHGYVLIAADVKCNRYFEFEDWWIDPDLVPLSRIGNFRSKSLHPSKMNWELIK